MRRHVIGMGRGRRNLGVHPGGGEAFFGEHGVVVAMDDVVGGTGVVRLLCENRCKYFATLTLIGEGLVGFGSGDDEREGVEDSSFVVSWVRRLYRTHPLLESLGVTESGFAVITLNFRQSVDVGYFASRGLPIGVRDLPCLLEGLSPVSHIAVAPQTMVVRHRHSPLCHATFWIWTGDFTEGLSCLVIRKGMHHCHSRLYAVFE